MATIYREADADPSVLTRCRIAVVGYGNQGCAQANNLRDSGAQVVIGNRDDDYAGRARADGFHVLPIADAVRDANVVMLLLPDEVTPAVFVREIAPNVRAGAAVCFASGYNVAYQLLTCPNDVDVILMAPRMVGPGVRDLYQTKEGFYSLVAIERDVTGSAKDILLALCWGIGTLWKGAVEVTFKMEAELDLFNEQAFGPAFGKVLLTSINTLVEAGYPKEVVLLEIYLSGELGYIFRTMSQTGLIKQLDDHSQTSQYGAISRGMRFLGVNLARPMRKILKNITSGKFAREWTWEQRTGKLRYRFLKAMALRQPINKMEQSVRKDLGITS